MPVGPRCLAKSGDEVDRQDRFPAKALRCLGKCAATFTCEDGDAVLAAWQCDGSEDCAEGSDERGCEYFRCGDGTLLRADDECDGFVDCEDASDEARCEPWCEGSETHGEGHGCGGVASCEPDQESCR